MTESNVYTYVVFVRRWQIPLLKSVPFYTPTNSVWEFLTTASSAGSIECFLTFASFIMSEVEYLFICASPFVFIYLWTVCSCNFPFCVCVLIHFKMYLYIRDISPFIHDMLQISSLSLPFFVGFAFGIFVLFCFLFAILVFRKNKSHLIVVSAYAAKRNVLKLSVLRQQPFYYNT